MRKVYRQVLFVHPDVLDDASLRAECFNSTLLKVGSAHSGWRIRAFVQEEYEVKEATKSGMRRVILYRVYDVEPDSEGRLLDTEGFSSLDTKT